jgi:hypothetical protein
MLWSWVSSLRFSSSPPIFSLASHPTIPNANQPIPTNFSYVNIPTKTFNGTKNLIFFAIGFAIVPWVKQNGLIAVFCILAAILFVVDLGAVVVYLFGKRARARDGRLRIFPF